MLLDAELSLTSIGEAARLLGVSVDRVARAASALGIKAAERRDGVPWLYDDDISRIRLYLCEPLMDGRR